VAAALAPANKPLMLLSAGLLLQPLALPQPRQVCVCACVRVCTVCAWGIAAGWQSVTLHACSAPPHQLSHNTRFLQQVRDVVAVNAVRIACGLFVAANVLALLPLLLPAPDGAAALGAGSSAGGAWALLSVLAAAVVLLSPLPPAQLDFTRSFRLNEALAAACRSASALASAPLLLLLAAAVGGLRLLPLGLPLPGAAAAAAAAAAAGGGSGGGGSSLELAAAAEPTREWPAPAPASHARTWQRVRACGSPATAAAAVCLALPQHGTQCPRRACSCSRLPWRWLPSWSGTGWRRSRAGC
jgi:hypothetical protein